MNIRHLALDSLLRIDYEGAYSNLETKRTLASKRIKTEDRRLYLNIVYGCLQNRLYLDYLIAQQSSTPLKKLDKSVSEILRIAVYQIYFLDKIPDYAIVNEAVSLAEEVQPKAKGFVNGVLRSLMRKIEEVGKNFKFENWDNEKEALSIRYSVPLWIVYKYFESFGKEKGEEIIKKLNEKPPFTIRCNTLKISRDDLIKELEILGAEPRKGKLSSNAIHLDDLTVFEKGIEESDLYKKGYFLIQDQGGMLIIEALNPKPGEKILDICGAPGGKTTYMSQLMENKGIIIGRDIFQSRLNLMKESNERLGCENISLEKQDGTQLLKEDKAAYDKILLDAPCTGLGVIRRKPEIRYHESKEDRKALVKIQGELLENAGYALKQGGELLYSTCTVNKDENENQIKKFLENHPEFKMIKNKDGKDFTITSPLEDECDSFFFVHLKKS